MKFFIFAAVFLLCFPAVAAAKKIIVPVLLRGTPVLAAHMDENMNVDTADFAPWAEKNLSAAGLLAFQALGATIPANGTAPLLGLTYDGESASLRLSPDSTYLRKKDINVHVPALAPGEEVLKPANVSAFVNLRGGQDIVTSGAGPEGRQPLRLDTDGAVNIKNWVVEGRADYLEGGPHPIARDETRLVRDLPDKMVRLAAGDLSYGVTGFQSFQPMLGVSVARNFSLQPYRVTMPTGETSFTLNSPARVDVIVNGQQARTLRLEPGSYNVADFPLVDGGNDVTLVITDGAGRVERKTFSLLSDQQLLQKGLHEYTYNAGIISQTTDRQIEYQAADPAASFFHRYGFSDTLTAGVSGQGDRKTQQAAVTALRVFPIGTVGIESALSRSTKGIDSAARVSFRRTDARTRRDFSALAIWRGAHFTALGQDAGAVNPSSAEFAMRYSQPVFKEINMGIGGRYRFSRAGMPDDWSYSASFSKAISPAVSVTLTAEHRRMDGAGIFFGITWTPQQSRHSVTSSVDTLAGRQDVQWNYRADRDVESFNLSAGTTRDNDGMVHATGGAGYTGYRGEARFRQDVTSQLDGSETESRSQVLFGTALAYSDGHTALSRPINGSFVMLPAHSNLAGRNIGINPASATGTEKENYQAEIDGFGPAVLPDATPYMYRPVRVDTRHLPGGYDIGRDVFTLLPSYKSGTVLTVGNAANIFADGYIETPAGQPVALEGGTIENRSDKTFTPQEFFTNAEGRFRISRLSPGTYIIRLGKHPGAEIPLVVPDKGIGRFDAGKLILTERPS